MMSTIRAIIIIGGVICIAGFVLLMMPNAWVNWQNVISGNVERTTLQVVQIPRWLGPASIALGIVLMLLATALTARIHH